MGVLGWVMEQVANAGVWAIAGLFGAGALLIGGIWWFWPGGGGPAPPVVQPTPTFTVTALATSLAGVPPPSSVDRDRGGPGAPGRCVAGQPCLRVSVSGPGSVQLNVREVSCPPTCEVSYPQGTEVRIQRRLSLPQEQEQASRISGWSGDCRLDAEREPRGGRCTLSMDRDRSVSVSFEARARVRITMTGNIPRSYGLTLHTQQKNGGLPPRADSVPCAALPCSRDFFYDVGSQLTIQPSVQIEMRRWGGLCGTAKGADERGNGAEPCAVVITGDGEITMQQSIPRCIGVASAAGTSVTCTFDPP